MKELRIHFHKEHESEFILGKINQTSKDYTYFSITTAELKKAKLKFVIILDHIMDCFTICLSGQNKSVRKKYWYIFKRSDYNKYHLAESMDKNLMIIDHTLVEQPDFNHSKNLTNRIEKESLIFMNELREILE